MKKLFIIFTLLFLSYPSLSFAHILQVDGEIGVILHINPEDDPIAGKPSHFHFDFTDADNKFSPEKCRCSVDIYQEEKKLYSFKLNADTPNPNKNGINFDYTFPKKAIYKIVLAGEPKETDGFQQFSLTYNIRVGRENGEISNSQTNIKSTAIVIIILGGSVTFLSAMHIAGKKKK